MSKKFFQQGFIPPLTLILVVVIVIALILVVKNVPFSVSEPIPKTVAPIIPEASVAPTNTLNPIKNSNNNSTIGWKDYSNTIYGQKITFKYPPSWSSIREKFSETEPVYNVTFCQKEQTSFSDCSLMISSTRLMRVPEIRPSPLPPSGSDKQAPLVKLQLLNSFYQYQVFINGVSFQFFVWSDAEVNTISTVNTLINTIQFTE